MFPHLRVRGPSPRLAGIPLLFALSLLARALTIYLPPAGMAISLSAIPLSLLGWHAGPLGGMLLGAAVDLLYMPLNPHPFHWAFLAQYMFMPLLAGLFSLGQGHLSRIPRSAHVLLWSSLALLFHLISLHTLGQSTMPYLLIFIPFLSLSSILPRSPHLLYSCAMLMLMSYLLSFHLGYLASSAMAQSPLPLGPRVAKESIKLLVAAPLIAPLLGKWAAT